MIEYRMLTKEQVKDLRIKEEQGKSRKVLTAMYRDAFFLGFTVGCLFMCWFMKLRSG